jgi:hypothetical protein
MTTMTRRATSKTSCAAITDERLKSGSRTVDAHRMTSSIASNRSTITQLAGLLRQLEEHLHESLRTGDASAHDEQRIHVLLESLDLLDAGDDELPRAVKVDYDAEPGDGLAAQQAQLTILGYELGWYNTAVTLASAGKVVREASHHDARDTLRSLGLLASTQA